MTAPDTPPKIYNLFPRLIGDVGRWGEHAKRANAMGFDWFYVNPVHFPGFSGSCYAVKDFYRLDPLLLPESHPDRNYDDHIRADGGIEVLRQALQQVRQAGLRPMIDLVLNHTSRDSPLVEQHPDWYVRNAQGEIQSPSAIDPADARKVTVWGDLAQLDHARSSDREALWDYWKRRVETYVDLGFEGFRCDAAYKIPSDLWRLLISSARQRNARVFFLAETLGARLEEVDALHDCGMSAVTNSSKYWAFDAPWCLDQQRDLARVTRSIAFPESHDTERLWTESSGRLSVQKQRYAFAAAFSTGVMMPVGFEYGFERRLHVVETRATDWEPANTNLEAFIKRVHDVCWSQPALCSEHVEAVSAMEEATLLLERRDEQSTAFIALNKDWHAPQHLSAPESTRGRRVVRICREAAADETLGSTLELEPAELVYVI